MSTISKINSTTTQAVQRYMEVRMTANGVGSVSGSNPGNAMGSPTSNPFPSIYYYRNYTGYKSGAKEFKKASSGLAFPEKIFYIDPSIISPSELSFQSERIKNVSRYEMNQIATGEDTASMEGDA